MQYVRCDACGAKALFAASRCPKCTHAFFLRDHRGEMVPLAHCRKCDTYYPRSVGGCKWCGTTSAPARFSPLVLALGAAAVLALGAFLLVRRAGRGDASGVPPDTLPAAPAAVVEAPPADEPPPRDSLQEDTMTPTVLPPDTMPSSPAAAVPVTTAPVVAIPPVAAPQAPANVRWVRAAATTYINVRSGPDRKAPVVGVVTPSMRVELGASVRGWRQVRAAGITGWADPRNFTEDTARAVR